MQDIYPGLQEGAGSRFLNYLQLIWYRRRSILLTTLVVAVLAAVWLSQQPPVYVSSSSLRIGLPEPQEAGGEIAQAGRAIDEVSGEVEVLRSRRLAALVVKQFQLQVYPEFNPEQDLQRSFPATTWETVKGWLRGLARGDGDEASREAAESPVLPLVIDRFLEQLSISRVGNSRVVRISFASHDPQLAARVANAIPNAYVSARQQARIQASASAADFAAEQFLELKERLVASERAEAFYRDTLDLEEARDIESRQQQISNLNSRLLIMEARRDEALDRLERLEGLAQGEDLSSEVIESLASPAIAALLEERSLLNERLQGLTAEDPQLERMNDDIAAANAAIRSELNEQVIVLQDEAAAASQEAIHLQSELATLMLESSTQNRRLLQLRELEKETDINRLRYEAATERIRQSSLGADLVAPDTEIISEAVISSAPLYPGRSRKMIYWVLAGFILGLLSVLVRQMRNPGLLSPEHVHFLLGESTIGVLPEVGHGVSPHDLVVDDPESEFTQAVGALKMTLDLADLDEPVKAIQLVSSTPGEGRAALAVALARTEAGAGRKVLLVSAHLRHSTIEEKVGLNGSSSGLTDLMLAENPDLDAYLQQDSRSGVQVLSAGTAEYANPDVVFSSQRMQSLVDEMKSRFEFIIFDTPPVMSTADAIAIGGLVDTTLFVVRWNKTPKGLVASSLRQMRAGGLDIAGVVLQHVNLQRYGNIGYSDLGYLYHQKR